MALLPVSFVGCARRPNAIKENRFTVPSSPLKVTFGQVYLVRKKNVG